MKNVSELYSRKERPVKVLQIGEGNFLRAFVDYGIDVANEELGFNSNVDIIVPIANKPARFAKGRLAGAVGPDQAVAVAVAELDGDVLEQGLGPELLGDVGCDEHGSVLKIR